MTHGSFVAVGDSFTEGLDDPYPDGAAFRGWADLLADRLAVRESGFRYANLAVRGKLLGEIVAEQVPLAEELRPGLVSIAGGGNDILRRRYDPELLAAQLDGALRRLAATGARVVVFTGADVTTRMPGTAWIRPRILALNETIRAAAARHGAVLVDPSFDRVFDDPRIWSEDRLHLNAAGHRRIASYVLDALGLPPEEAWRPTPPVAPPAPWSSARRDDLRWIRVHVAPWMRRRLARKSSGDTALPKRPVLEPLVPADGTRRG